MYNEAVLGNGLGMRQEGKQVVLKEHMNYMMMVQTILTFMAEI